MQTKGTVTGVRWQRMLPEGLGLYALVAGAVSFSGWPADIPRLTDWFDDGVSIQPNTAILIAMAGAAMLLLHAGYRRVTLALGAVVAAAGAVNLLQYVVDADFGFNDLLLFGREWGQGTTVSPGRFGPPASISFMLIGASLASLSARKTAARCYVPSMALVVVVLISFSLFGYLFGARDFYAIPSLSAIAFPTSTMFLALAVSVIVSVPERQPMLLLCEHSSAGTMARTVLPILIVMIPLVTWARATGFEHALFDLGTGRALSAVVLVLGVVVLMWIALLALRRREQLERDADRRKDEFLATLAHELRNPLAPINNATSLLKLAPEDRGVFEQATETIERQLAHLMRLIDDLLDASRISRGKLSLQRERVEVSAVIQQAVEACRPLSDQAHQEVTLTMPAEPIYVDADPIRLSQVVCNLLNNACKFAGEHGRLSLMVERVGGEALIAVKDDGIGIAADKLEYIFEMFSQVDQSLERTHGGLGIGLTLAKQLVELHGGRIEAHSEGSGKGSEFVVRLPVAAGAPPLPDEPDDESGAGDKRRILVVDDNRDSANSLAMLLKLTGHETFIAFDGEEALAVASEQRPDVILMDIGLPKLNGFDACRRLRAEGWAEDALIIALTGWGQTEDRRKSAEAGFNGHLVKPVDHGELMRLLSCPAPHVEGSLAD